MLSLRVPLSSALPLKILLQLSCSGGAARGSFSAVVFRETPSSSSAAVAQSWTSRCWRWRCQRWRESRSRTANSCCPTEEKAGSLVPEQRAWCRWRLTGRWLAQQMSGHKLSKKQVFCGPEISQIFLSSTPASLRRFNCCSSQTIDLCTQAINELCSEILFMNWFNKLWEMGRIDVPVRMRMRIMERSSCGKPLLVEKNDRD